MKNWFGIALLFATTLFLLIIVSEPYLFNNSTQPIGYLIEYVEPPNDGPIQYEFLSGPYGRGTSVIAGATRKGALTDEDVRGQLGTLSQQGDVSSRYSSGTTISNLASIRAQLEGDPGSASLDLPLEGGTEEIIVTCDQGGVNCTDQFGNPIEFYKYPEGGLGIATPLYNGYFIRGTDIFVSPTTNPNSPGSPPQGGSPNPTIDRPIDLGIAITALDLAGDDQADVQARIRSGELEVDQRTGQVVQKKWSPWPQRVSRRPWLTNLWRTYPQSIRTFPSTYYTADWTPPAQRFSVRIGPKGPNHPFFGKGSNLGYMITTGEGIGCGASGARLELRYGLTYEFDVYTVNDCVTGQRRNDPFFFTTDPEGGSENGNIFNLRPTSNGTIRITITKNLPQKFYYQSTNSKYVGGQVFLN